MILIIELLKKIKYNNLRNKRDFDNLEVQIPNYIR